MLIWRLASLDEVIADREDIYEYLSEMGIDERRAFDIAEYVRKGLVSSKGWKPNMYKLLRIVVFLIGILSLAKRYNTFFQERIL